MVVIGYNPEHNETEAQQNTWLVLRREVAMAYGEDVVLDIIKAADIFVYDNNRNWADAYDYAISLCREKLKTPTLVLSPDEYYEVIKAQEIMEELM